MPPNFILAVFDSNINGDITNKEIGRLFGLCEYYAMAKLGGSDVMLEKSRAIMIIIKCELIDIEIYILIHATKQSIIFPSRKKKGSFILGSRY